MGSQPTQDCQEGRNCCMTTLWISLKLRAVRWQRPPSHLLSPYLLPDQTLPT